MKCVFLGAVALCCLASGILAKPQFFPSAPRNFPEHGPNVERTGFCPRNPEQSLCDTNFCNQDNHCAEAQQKCCPVGCGGMMCINSIPGVRRHGACPDFWLVPVEKYPATPVNECDTDGDCAQPSYKCCGTDTSGIRKCVSPRP